MATIAEKLMFGRSKSSDFVLPNASTTNGFSLHFDGTVGTSGITEANGRNVTATNMTLVGDGRFAQAGSFSSGGQVSFADSLNFTTTFWVFVDFWYKLDSPLTVEQQILYGTNLSFAGGTNNGSIYMTPTGFRVLDVTFDTNITSSGRTVNVPVNSGIAHPADGQWHHLALFTYGAANQSNNTAAYWLDGVLQKTQAFSLVAGRSFGRSFRNNKRIGPFSQAIKLDEMRWISDVSAMPVYGTGGSSGTYLPLEKFKVPTAPWLP